MPALMRRSKWRLVLSGALLTGLLAFIWINSAMPAQTSGQFSGFVGKLLGSILPFLSPDTPDGAFLIRKLAHFSEFAALGASLGWLFGMLLSQPWPGMLIPAGCGIAAACVDESIQHFSPGRYCSALDVCIDSAGVIIGLTFLLTLHWLLSKRGK